MPPNPSAMTRRRFIAVTATATGFVPLAGPVGASSPPAQTTLRWRGPALGAAAEITLIGPRATAERALKAAQAAIARAMAEFNLYDPASALGRLNATGRLDQPSDAFHRLCAQIDRLHAVTDGLFDPSVQRLWTAGDLSGTTHWGDVSRRPDLIALPPGASLTFNGIAQGYATDLVSAELARHGFEQSLVNIGEMRGRGGPWRIGLADPKAGLLGTRQISDGAVATSSPGALTLAGGISHIVHPGDPARAPLWSTVSVEATTATLADGLSTALCHLDRPQMAAILDQLPEVTRVSLVDEAGDLTTLRTARP